MVKSMTGFDQSIENENGYEITCELKSVNHRYFDVHIRIPRRYELMADKLKDEIKEKLDRGRIDIDINIEKTNDMARNIRDKDLALAYLSR